MFRIEAAFIRCKRHNTSGFNALDVAQRRTIPNQPCPMELQVRDVCVSVTGKEEMRQEAVKAFPDKCWVCNQPVLTSDIEIFD